MGKVGNGNAAKFMWIFILGVIALLISIYLVVDHIQDKDESYCDVSSHISCSKVRRSEFSELFRVPVALFGVIYNMVTIAFALCGYKQTNQKYISGMFYWSVFGATFIFYLIMAEIYLSALCPFCTILHILQFIIVYLSWKIYNTQTQQITLFETLNSLKLWILIIAILNFIPIIGFNSSLSPPPPKFEPVPKEFCDCVTFSGWRFYGKAGCGWCEKQKQIFGDSIKYIVFIDCANVEEVCKQLNIDGFPTWIRFTDDGEELDRLKGYQSLELLSTASNCPLSAEFFQSH